MKNTVFWKLESQECPAPSWLFGTMHVRDGRAFEKIAPVLDKIEDCPAFAAEFHLNEAASQADPTSMLLPDGKRLSDFLRPAKYQKLRCILLKASGLDIDYYGNALPFLLINLCGERILRSEMPLSLDLYLWQHAEAHDKSLHGIETYAEQIAVLKKIPLDDQFKMLIGMAKSISSYRQHLLHLTELYREGDIRRLYQSVKSNSKGLRKMMLYERNIRMADRTALLIAKQSTFVAIGAGHLAGEKGVLRLLKQRGVKISPVML